MTKLGFKNTGMFSQKNNVVFPVLFGLLVVSVFSTSFAYGETVQVDIDGESYNVEYSGSGVSISGIEADLDFVSLILDVNVTGSDSTLDITFDRTFFDSKYEGTDESFIILADGDEPNFIETQNNSQSRTLSIQVPSGTEEIEIIGSVFGDDSSVLVIDIPEVEEPTSPESPEELGIAPFVDESLDPQSYVDRYNNESSYKEWFDENYPEYSSIYEAVGLEEPVVEEPEPVVEEPESVVEEHVVEEENPRTECGPGTTLKDGVCVLDEKCGPGTILEDGVCVLSVIDPPPSQTDTSPKGLGKEMVYGVIAAFVVAGIIGIILALMSKASKSKD